MSELKQDKCKKCGRYIVWAKMPSGKWCPFVKVTTYRIDGEQAAKDISEEGLLALYISHYVDCPNSGEFGKNKKKEDESPYLPSTGTIRPM